MSTRSLGRKILLKSETESTNVWAKKAFQEAEPSGTVFLADSQTQGRGRLGRNWYSKPGCGIYCSILVRPRIAVDAYPQLTLAAGVAVAESLRATAKVDATLKWPNDVLLNQKKVSGILCEFAQTQSGDRAAIIGIGINVNHERENFSGELERIATSLKAETQQIHDRNVILAAMIQSLESKLDLLENNSEKILFEEWTQLCGMIGKTVSLMTGKVPVEGTAIGLDEQGKLLLDTTNGQRRAFDCGEVSFDAL
ncbi:MAG: biotin--[acetyl-CoA-carboxylase] ligase [Candidatus Nitrohelix vancouverensis]|uniref:biotin--[biotin carboxyl-carrier protein] ligase n=1 Tax=Candidatus Nitrohelix vancouverensis TaxID=2705534 RepID=A0A7T0C301_9BACT|nr:MAG: biotin--[acetyl-CoA-carboxylase] ligase [Candidatus Nitrohelix vancouverensis]